jgi:hypothetical protein
MDYFPVMNMLYGQAQLCEPVEDLIFTEITTLGAFYLPAKVTTVCVIHDDIQGAIFNVGFDTLDDVWMIKCL